jgi:hypothetical protein
VTELDQKNRAEKTKFVNDSTGLSDKFNNPSMPTRSVSFLEDLATHEKNDTEEEKMLATQFDQIQTYILFISSFVTKAEVSFY